MNHNKILKSIIMYQVITFFILIWITYSVKFELEVYKSFYMIVFLTFKLCEFIFIKSLYRISKRGISLLITLGICELHVLYMIAFNPKFLVIGYIVAIIILQRFAKHSIELFCQESIQDRFTIVYKIYLVLGFLSAIGFFYCDILPVLFNIYVLITLIFILINFYIFSIKIKYIFRKQYSFLIILMMLISILNISIPLWNFIVSSYLELFSIGWITILITIMLILTSILFYRNRMVASCLDLLLAIILTILISIIIFVFILNVNPTKLILYGTLFLFMPYILYLIFEINSTNVYIKKTQGLGIQMMLREEKIQKDVSVFLHDEILQDLNAVIQLLQLKDQQNNKKLIEETIKNLSVCIRNKMNNYSPKLLDSASLYDNYYLLINMLLERYKNKDIVCRLNASKNIMLIAPYDILVYRWIRETVNNAFKYSEARNIEVTIDIKDNHVKIIIEDDGVYCDTVPIQLGHGLSTIKEQVECLQGNFVLYQGEDSGLGICIEFDLEGDGAVEYFINR
ncbi:putative two-component sensor histidine kinase [Clostridium perfringens D str. JGS1721]|uniref:Putative two-component sensor histidine kinase n=1 Tax=Clostridium perfringens D str. JGS1721 TaxID=488537 RepID=B1V0D3_CLOPF|nr:hypothetical protein [Clostridium perfringens]EDT72707.1 putative two-component sensor histidine kinase [Clostridium perfringens D str. JGS1721]